jgi:hypothetical protein
MVASRGSVVGEVVFFVVVAVCRCCCCRFFLLLFLSLCLVCFVVSEKEKSGEVRAILSLFCLVYYFSFSAVIALRGSVGARR